ncbi:ParB/RepB/Spo0J family partition protein [Actinomyces dentalis]|uniref:ParB/RepB/Spo0J family partition protein n=1 Tax=Actinomyces dentalis TaxID=272548 RepID=UPI0028E4A0E8|nr:ParB/RepB/Spo0J family partition protein [Actinomyces dentalis]
MAQKKRGLGRGLQALIPEAQTEIPSRRPTDVFFPESRSPARSKTTADEASDAASRHAAEIASTLLAPSKRTRGRRSSPPATATKPSAAAAKPKSGRARSGSESTGRSEGTRTGRRRSRVSRETLMAEAPELALIGLGDRPEDQTTPSADRSKSRGALEDGTAGTAGARGGGKKKGSSDDAGLVPVPGATFAELPVEIIVPNPRQPRQVFDEDDITELAASIKEVGLLQPIVVRRVDDEEGRAESYELVMGERRLRAAKEAGLKTIPAVVRYTEDQDLLRDALLENLHRVQLNPLEEAAAYQQLLDDFSCTHAELSKRIARSRSQISNTLRLMKLPPLVQRRLAAGVLSAGHARALLGLPDAAAMERLAQRIVAEGLSVRATEELVALHDEPQAQDAPRRTAGSRTRRSAPLPALSTRLSDAFDTRVKVTRGSKKGRITIEFAGDEDLARIVETLIPGTTLTEN